MLRPGGASESQSQSQIQSQRNKTTPYLASILLLVCVEPEAKIIIMSSASVLTPEEKEHFLTHGWVK